jgi:RNA ligase (TIGR02306 family)
MSTEHDVTVTRIGAITRHPDADTLSITEVDGRPCIIRTGEWSEGDLALYVPIDSIVNTKDPRFAFLADKAKADGRYRIKAMRLRGIFSMGVLVRPDADMVEGEEVREHLGIEVHEGPEVGNSIEAGQMERDPGFMPTYDIESLRKWSRVLSEGEEVVLTEKIHGASARFAYYQGRLWIATRSTYRLSLIHI